MSNTTPAMTVFLGDVKMAPMSVSLFILLMELANPERVIVILEARAFNGRTQPVIPLGMSPPMHRR
ncbi:MAG: hypothetical protein ACKOEC_09845 [Acidimicrobiia bacterium]